MRPEKEECECEECGKAFPDRRAYNAHRRQEHTKEKLFECDVCGRKATKMSNLKIHMLIHSGEKRFKCEQCRRPFARAPDLRKHMRVHTGEKPYECKECGLRFAQTNSLYGHKCANDPTRKRDVQKPKLQRRPRRSKATEPESSSSDDDYSPNRRAPSDEITDSYSGVKRSERNSSNPIDVGSRLKRGRGRPRKANPPNDPTPSVQKESSEPLEDIAKDMKRGIGRPRKRCHVNQLEKPHSALEKKEIRKDDPFDTKSDGPSRTRRSRKDSSNSDDELPQHQRRSAAEGAKTIECEECEEEFDGRRAYNAHVRKMHTWKNVFECDECAYKCGKPSKLKLHMLVHTGEKRFKCEHCGKPFARKGDLVKHVYIHTGEKPYGCEECGRKFLRTAHLHNHKCKKNGRVEPYVCDTGEKPKAYECDVCPYKTSKRSNINAHLVVHSGEKRFKCEECGTAFGQKGTLTKHMRIHTGEKPYACTQCGRRFAQTGSLYGHTCGSGVVVDYRYEQGQNSPFDTSSSDDDFPEERQQAHSDRNWNKQRSLPRRKRGLDYASSSVKSPSEKRQRQEARPSAPTGAARPKYAGPLTDLNSYLKDQHSKLETALRRGAGLEKRSADDVDESCDSATSTSPSELQDLRAMEEHYTDDFDYESLML